MSVRALALASSMLLIGAACGGGTAQAPSAAPSATSAAATATAAPRVASIKVLWTSLSGASSGLWTAFEAGYFKRYTAADPAWPLSAAGRAPSGASSRWTTLS